MAILKNIEQQTNNRFLNMYNLLFHNEKTGHDFNYFVASRKNKEDLVAATKDHTKADAVMMFCIDKEKKGVYLIKQFRPAINDYVLESPAGLVDNGESIETAAKREIFEETGLNVVSMEQVTPVCYTSEGMSDESIMIYKVYVSGTPNTENKEENEDIEVLFFSFNEISDIIQNKYGIVSIKTLLMLRLIALENNESI